MAGGISVPNLEAPSVQEEPLPGRPYPRFDTNVPEASFGEPIARGIEAVSAEETQEAAKQKVQNDNLRVIDANTQLEAGRNALLYGQPDAQGNRSGGAFSLHGKDAMNLPATVIPQYQKMADQIGSTLTPDQRRLFQAHIDAGSNELNLQLNRYEYQEANRLSNEIYSNGASQAVESASVGWRDPNVIGKSRADIKGLVSMQGDREGWSDSEKAAQTQKLLAEMHFSVIDRMLADGDPRAALRYFVGTQDQPGVRDSNELTGEQAHQLGAAIDAAMRQHQADITTNVAAKVADVRAAAMNGMAVPPSAMPTTGELQAAYPERWQEVQGAIRNDINMGADLKSFGAMTPQEIAARVDSYRPTGVQGAAEGFERYNIIAAAAQRTFAERAKDPRQYAIDNQLGSKPLDFQDPQAMGTELRARIASTGPLSRQMGGYVPPLTRDEAGRLAQSLASQNPADQLRSLMTLHQAVGNDVGFQEIMHQVLPGSPVTAIVGSQVAAANPQTAPVWFDRHYAMVPADATRILQGEQLLAPAQEGEKGARKPFPMPPDGGAGGMREQFQNAVGDTFRSRPELGEATYQAFKAAYASLLSERGDLSGQGNTSLRKQALSIAVGNMTSFQGNEVVVPQGMDPSRFPGLVRHAVQAEAANTGSPQDWESKIRGYQLREVGGLGSGRYELINGNMPLTRADGQGLFEIDLRGQYLPDAKGVHGSPQDVARAAAETHQAQPASQPISAGTARVEPPTPKGTSFKAPPIPGGTGKRGGGGRGGAHPSQAPEAD